MARGETYEEFTEKFKPKLTTDDCYTPTHVYDAVMDWVCQTYGIDPDCVVRPFWPGADYEAEDYSGKVVIDNPPFSIISKIVRKFMADGVKFFLFAPSLTLFGLRNVADLVFMPVCVDVTYTNGAVVRTSFISNLEHGCVWIDAGMRDVVQEAADMFTKAQKVTRPKYKMPINVWNGASMLKIAAHGVSVKIDSSHYRFIRRLESQKHAGKSIFGGGLIFDTSAAEHLDEARRNADEARRNADEARQITWELSDAERQIVADMDEANNA